MRPLIVAGLKADIVGGVFAREAADEGHADIALDVLGARVKELAVPEDGIAGLADEFASLGGRFPPQIRRWKRRPVPTAVSAF